MWPQFWIVVNRDSLRTAADQISQDVEDSDDEQEDNDED